MSSRLGVNYFENLKLSSEIFMKIKVMAMSQRQSFKALAIFCGCTAWFVSDLVSNPKDRFSQDTAHI